MTETTIDERTDAATLAPRIGRYAIVEELAKGGMAQLYVVRRDGDYELRVLKRVLDSFRGHEMVGKRFHREAWISSLLDHPNVIRTSDAGMEGGIFCLVTELIAGKNVAAMLDAERQRALAFSAARAGFAAGLQPGLPVPIAVAIALAALEGLQYAHELRGPDGDHLGIVHRDVTPRNILIGYGGEVKLIDFGVVRGDVGEFRTAPGVIVGSLEYLSPEQAIAEPVDRRSDIYSLGTVLYEMLTGRAVISQSDKLVDVLGSIVRDVPPRASRVNPAVPEAIEVVVERATAKAPRDRYQSALEMRNALFQAAQAAKIEPAGRPAIGNYLRGLLPEGEKWFRRLIESNRELVQLGPHPSDVLSAPTAVESRNAGMIESTELVPRPSRSGVRAARAAARVASDQTQPDAIAPTRSSSGAALAAPSRSTSSRGTDPAQAERAASAASGEAGRRIHSADNRPGSAVAVRGVSVTRGRSGSASGSGLEPTAISAAGDTVVELVRFGPLGPEAYAEPPPPAPSEATKLGAVVLEMPGEAVLTAHGLVPRKIRELRRMLAAVVLVALMLAGAVVYNFLSPPEVVVATAVNTTPPPPALLPPAPPAAEPGIVAREKRPEPPPAPPPAPVKESKPARSSRAATPAKTITPPPDPPPQPPPEPPAAPKVTVPYPELRALLKELRATTERDNKRYVKLLEGISRAANDLPAAEKRAIEKELSSAELTYDVEGLARALQALIKAKS